MYNSSYNQTQLLPPEKVAFWDIQLPGAIDLLFQLSGGSNDPYTTNPHKRSAGNGQAAEQPPSGD